MSQTARQLFGPLGSCMGLDSTGSAALGVLSCTHATPYLEPNFSSQANLGVVLEIGSSLSVATLMELNSESVCPMHSILANILILSCTHATLLRHSIWGLIFHHRPIWVSFLKQAVF